MPPSINRDIAKSIGLAVRNDTITVEGTVSGGGGGVSAISGNSDGVFTDGSLDSSGYATGDLFYQESTNTFLIWNDSDNDYYKVTTASSRFNEPSSATGGTITQDGAYKVHTFTSSSNFIVDGSLDVEYLVIAGGGGGGGKGGGGGGAGGYRTNLASATSGGGGTAESSTTLTSGTYTVTVGAGGNGGASGGNGTTGEDSVFNDITSAGGGSGAVYGSGNTGGDGGSGGGGGKDGGQAGSGTTNQGYDGGLSEGGGGYAGAGGGGAGAAGNNGLTGEHAGDGGAGVASNIDGSTVTRAGGGGGGTNSSSAALIGNGGTGGGGHGGLNNDVREDGTANTGGGGGGGSWSGTLTGGNGGSGIVIVRYPYSGAITESDRPLQMFTTTPNPASTGYKNSTYISNTSAGDGNFTIFTTNNSASAVGDASNTADLPSGKRYGEIEVTGSGTAQIFGIVPNDYTGGYNTTNANMISVNTGDMYPGAVSSGLGAGTTTGDIHMIAYDTDNQKVWFGLNGTWFTQGTPGSSGGLELYGTSSDTYMMFMGSISGTNYTNEWKTYRNLGNFNYTVPTGFLSW